MRTRRTRILSLAVLAGLVLAVPASVAASDGRPHYIRPGAPGEPSVRIDPNTIAVPLRPSHAELHFLHHMIPHHGQAVFMGDLAVERANDSRVRNLARQIQLTQEGEIERMADILRRFDEHVPDPYDWEDHWDMEGMLSQEQLDELEAASGHEFDLLFLEYMIFHHFGAITMAEETEEATGGALHADISDILYHVIDSQWGEIQWMQSLLRELDPD